MSDEYTTASPRRRRAIAAERASISYHDGSATMASVPVEDRPREKLARAGADALGDNELLALVIGSGTRSRGALAVAQDVIAMADGLSSLARLGMDDLERVPGIGASRAARVLAAVELGRRTLTRDSPDRPRFLTIKEAAHYLMPRFGGYVVERVGVMLLDQKHRLIRTAVVSTGTLDGTVAEPRDIYRLAVAASAASVVVFHNHPSGDPSPSTFDRLLTRRLAVAGDMLGIELADHIILGDGTYFSFKEESKR
ncbi:MAG: DNA repair protein RadC [Acidobacteriota bacterium]|nr:DNA repair protein RadC [Acidobacteriota bacterium]